MKYLQIVILLSCIAATATITHKIDDSIYQKGIILRQKLEIDRQTKVVVLQSEISKANENKRNEIQNRYDHLMSQYSGLRKQRKDNVPIESTAIKIPSDGLRIFGRDAGALITFAKRCSITELERNEVIQQYNALEAE